MFAIFGAVGQAIYNEADARQSRLRNSEPKKDFKTWLGTSRWSPMKALSDKEYAVMLEEKLLKVNVEIALVDESLEMLKAQEKGAAAEDAVEDSKVRK